jgi:hypothetical protein
MRVQTRRETPAQEYDLGRAFPFVAADEPERTRHRRLEPFAQREPCVCPSFVNAWWFAHVTAGFNGVNTPFGFSR